MNNTIEKISPDLLSFDCSNPRIAEFNLTKDSRDDEILETLWGAMEVEEIVLSINASGFFENEPLIAIKEGGNNIVIEGNRRLAAIKCILHPEKAEGLGINKNILSVSSSALETLKEIPVIFVQDRKEAWKFIGFKHINGAQKWGGFAKAQYISQIRNEFKIPLTEIASQIGDTNNTVKKLYQGLQVIEQAEKLHKFDRKDIPASRLYFSHLYTALTYDGFKDYLSLQDVSEDKEDPVPSDKYDNLEEVLLWIFGSKKKEVNPLIQSQNPDLRRLEAVVKNKEAVLALRDGTSLIQAYEISQPKDKTFEQSLLEAKRALQKAQSYLTEGFDGKDESLLRQAGTIAQIAEDLYDVMEQKWKTSQGTLEKRKRMTNED